MSIDIQTETLVALKAACKLPAFCHSETGRACNFSKLWRIVTIGARDANGERVKLETVRVPGGLRTSIEAVDRFIHKLTDPAAAAVPNMRTPQRRQRDHAAAVKSLQRRGIMAPVGV